MHGRQHDASTWTVGLAMLFALSLVDWHNPAARAAPAKPAAIAVSAEAAMGVAQRKPKAATKWEKKLEGSAWYASNVKESWKAFQINEF